MRSCPCSLPAKARSTSSPVRWPWASLIFLKSSRSMKATDNGQPWRPARRNSCSSTASSWRRLSTPVKASRWAWSARRLARASNSSARRRAWSASCSSRRLRRVASSWAWSISSRTRAGEFRPFSNRLAMSGSASLIRARTWSKRALSSSSRSWTCCRARSRAASASSSSQMSATAPDSCTQAWNGFSAAPSSSLWRMLSTR
ncbi:hypothetical protein D3C73_1057670 [compost metagenome]